MKKFLTLALCIVIVMSTVLVGCGETDTGAANVKFGAGVYVGTPTVTDATEDKDGSGKIDVTVAAVTVDADGKIVACQLDTASNTVSFTADGKAIANESFKTKYELGADYNMVAYGGAVKEWFEQADAFEAVVAGKTLDEVKALVAEGAKGTEEVINAGCTITISDFVAAIEKAYNAAAAEVSADAALKVSIATEQTIADVTEDKDGSNKVSVNIFAAAIDADGKALAASSDCVEVTFTFNAEGVSTLDTAKAVVSKREQGANYGMVAYGGAAKEWFEQADAFDAACIGKTAAEIAGLMGEDGKGTSDLQTAGCTIYVTGFVKAATK
ncbi:MAG: hypothetical protein IKV47_07390 [Oscillospiraceae bacterium]|nr:hypothetical protein [Oscillospiraceae bacterium]